MQTTKPLFGASRLPLTTKRGNKDYYKGTRQAFIPGTSVRTGRPGAFQANGGSKFSIDDKKVRQFVAPPAELYHQIPPADQPLKPYVTTQLNARGLLNDLLPLPNIGPIPTPHSALRKTPEYKAHLDKLRQTKPQIWERITNRAKAKVDFTREYRALPAEEREALKMLARKEWFAKYQLRIAHIKENGFSDS